MPKERKPSISGNNYRNSSTNTLPSPNKGGIILVAIAVILIIAVLFAIFSGPSGSNVSDARALLVQAEAVASKVPTESVNFQGSLEMDAGGVQFSIPFSGLMRVDEENKRMYSKITLEPIIEDGEALTLESYMIDNEVYNKVGEEWVMYELPNGSWDTTRFSESITQLMQSFEPDLSKKETINGKETYKVKITPTIEELAEFLTMIDPGFLGQVGDFSQYGASLGEGVRAIEMDIWIDTKTYLPARVKFVIELETNAINPAGSGVVDSEIAIIAEGDFDYETKFSIVLPDEALME